MGVRTPSTPRCALGNIRKRPELDVTDPNMGRDDIDARRHLGGPGSGAGQGVDINQWIKASTSPPTFSVRARRSLTIPFGVLRIWMPMPPRTGRRSL